MDENQEIILEDETEINNDEPVIYTGPNIFALALQNFRFSKGDCLRM